MIGAQALATAARSLWDHKVRSLLTILGVVIGIGSVVTVVTLGASFEAFVVGQFDSVDDRSVFVTAGLGGAAGGPPTAGPFGTIFTESDRAGLESLPGVIRVEATGKVALSSIEFGSLTLPYSAATAASTEAQDVRDPEAYAEGGVFRMGAREAVLGSNVASFFGNDTIDVGDNITFVFQDGGRLPVRIAGVLTAQDSLLPGADNNIYVPMDPFYDVTIRSPRTGGQVLVYDALTVVADDPRFVGDVRKDVRSYMEDESDANQLRRGQVQIFVATAGDITDAIGDTFDQITLVFAIIAVVSLVVGAIGIANIMLVAVAERTREIGVMKAIGALDSQVLGLFLMEAALVGTVGAVIGVAMGLAGGYALVLTFFADEEIGVIVPYGLVAASVVVGLGVGLVAGLLPARRATKIQPVEALAHE